MKTVCLAYYLALLSPQEKVNPDLKYDQASGFSVMKPPKNDEWAFREKEKGGESPSGALLRDARLCLAHKVDELVIEVHMFPQAVTDLKKQIDADWTFFSSSPVFTAPEKVSMQAAKFPGISPGGVNAQYLELKCSKGDKPFEIREWLFIGKENRYTYKVIIHGDAGTHKKHQKAVDYILTTFKTWKPLKN